ncbi:MAG: hypothetical protein QOE33_3101 [Acidobacteriota bacterium]|nr:hypothetical protein [Acidobacteriota bacterium]
MKKVDSVTYEVRHGENITIKVTPKNFGSSLSSVSAVLDGGEFAPKPGTEDTPVYPFCVTKPVDEIHTVIMEMNFIAGSPDAALYEVVISGKNDQGCPCGFTIEKADQNLEPAIDFVVVG